VGSRDNKRRLVGPGDVLSVHMAIPKASLRAVLSSCVVGILLLAMCYVSLDMNKVLQAPVSISFKELLQPDGAPSLQVVRASELHDRVPRQLNNQNHFASLNSCPSSPLPAESPVKITLATQLSANRFWVVPLLCRRWKDPIVAVVYLEETCDANATTADNLEERVAFLVDTLTVAPGCPHMHLIVYVQDVVPAPFYPINRLRNLALEAVRTSHVLMDDIDFVPSVTLANDIREAWAMRRKAGKADWQASQIVNTTNATDATKFVLPPSPFLEALVVPAMELSLNEVDKAEFIVNPASHQDWIPSNFDELLTCVDRGDCQTFSENVRMHGSTKTAAWLAREWYDEWECPTAAAPSTNTTLVRDVRRILCVEYPGYEPYVAIPWCPIATADEHVLTRHAAPYYDERFVAYGWNKVSYIQHLQSLGYLFWVIPSGFVLHVPHAFSVSRESFDFDKEIIRKPMRQTWVDFQHELNKLLGKDSIRMPMCEKLDEGKGWMEVNSFEACHGRPK
jgi:glycosyltransferase-like protein LARGE